MNLYELLSQELNSNCGGGFNVRRPAKIHELLIDVLNAHGIKYHFGSAMRLPPRHNSQILLSYEPLTYKIICKYHHFISFTKRASSSLVDVQLIELCTELRVCPFDSISIKLSSCTKPENIDDFLPFEPFGCMGIRQDFCRSNIQLEFGGNAEFVIDVIVENLDCVRAMKKVPARFFCDQLVNFEDLKEFDDAKVIFIMPSSNSVVFSAISESYVALNFDGIVASFKPQKNGKIRKLLLHQLNHDDFVVSELNRAFTQSSFVDFQTIIEDIIHPS